MGERIAIDRKLCHKDFLSRELLKIILRSPRHQCSLFFCLM